MDSDLSFSTTFYIRQSKNETKNYRIYCCIKAGSTRQKELCIPGPIKREDWNLGKGYPKQTRHDLIQLSLFLDAVKAKLYTIYYEMRRKGSEISADLIKKRYLGEEQEFTFLQLIDKALAKYQTELAPGSLKNYKATRRYMEAFCKMKYTEGDISLKHLTYAFIDEFKTYILTTPLVPNDPCNNNGCMKHLERIKKIVAWAHEMRYIDRDVFLSYKIKKHRYISKYLHWDQLQTLEHKTFCSSMIALVRDLFVFCCYTGMAPVDMQRLQPSQIYKDKDGIVWISYVRAKSGNPAKVPLLNPALVLIEKYRQQENTSRSTVFPYVPNQVFNRNLKVISEACELGISINFYMARHTFATTIALLNGVPITSIKEMMGHERIDSTMVYIKIHAVQIAQHMKQVQGKIDKQKTGKKSN